jgi:integrase
LINSTLIEVNGTINKADTKTPSSRRKVALPRFLVEEFAVHISAWSNGDGRVFSASEGGPVSRTNWRRRFWLPAPGNSIGGHLRCHDLRHSHAAQLIAQGEHVKAIADRLGHANPMVTLTTYAHLFDSLDRDAADRLDDAWTRSVTDPRGVQTRLAGISSLDIRVDNPR